MIDNTSKVFIIGASGFVGGRLAERLFLRHNIRPACLVRDYSKLSRLSRFPMQIVHGDLLDVRGYENEVKECDIFVFSAHGKDNDPKTNWTVNTTGLTNMLELAARNKAKHFIFLSSSAIFEEQFEAGEFDENVTPVCRRRDYAGGKLEGERICREFSKTHGLPVTILRPTIIYGPFAPSFTIYPALLARSGALKNYGGFTGTCNPVYIDDVVDAIIASMKNEKAYNETFFLSSGESFPWERFFNSFCLAVSGKPLQSSNRFLFRLKTVPLRILKSSVKLVMRMTPRLVKSVYGFLRSRGSGNWSWVKGQDASTIRPKQYKKRLVFKIGKLTSVLGFTPKYDFTAGFEITAEWLRHDRYADPAASTVRPS